jgi:hypothetical protein
MIYAATYTYPSLTTIFGGEPMPALGGLQWLIGIEPDQITLTDKLQEAYVSPSAKIKDVNCLESSGAQTITNANIANGAVVTNAGTAVGTATAGLITFTAGTISQVALDGVMTYVCEEGVAFPLDVSVEGNDITAMTCTWTTSDTLANGSWNTAIGFTLLEYITLLLTTIPPMSLVPDLNQIPA